SLAGVDADPDARESAISSERALRVDCRSDGLARRAERDEERVSLRVDHFTAVFGDRVLQDALVHRQKLAVAISAQIAEHLGRPLDVGEKEGAGRRCHAAPAYDLGTPVASEESAATGALCASLRRPPSADRRP